MEVLKGCVRRFFVKNLCVNLRSCHFVIDTSPHLPKKEDGWDTTVYKWFVFFLHRNIPVFCLDKESDLKTYPDIGQAAFDTTRRIFVSVRG
ncbi:hypothetical protein F2Q68_00031505 [Brassica cretica]|uniref:Uncharacterized protein n=1 Tax=Brassica cretica TaxID=69181 RepID=A0A8S9GFA4_BRACR|nr:hypothetical protein F2Q68_00031505 [Brassica cretica]